MSGNPKIVQEYYVSNRLVFWEKLIYMTTRTSLRSVFRSSQSRSYTEGLKLAIFPRPRAFRRIAWNYSQFQGLYMGRKKGVYDNSVLRSSSSRGHILFIQIFHIFLYIFLVVLHNFRIFPHISSYSPYISSYLPHIPSYFPRLLFKSQRRRGGGGVYWRISNSGTEFAEEGVAL